MVKNIVFDIGNVLATFRPRDFLKEFFHDDALVERFYDVFFKELWHKYDQGVYLKEDLIRLGVLELPEFEHEIIQMMNTWVHYLKPIPSSVDLIDVYKSKGYKVYIISNLPKDSYDYLVNHYDFIQKMDGGIYSYQHLLIKPDKKIFELFLETYQLKGEECLFIDDNLENVASAALLKFNTIYLEDWMKLSCLIEEKLNEV